MTTREITGIHHVGLVVHDMGAALETFRTLGFTLDPPSYPALPPEPGTAPEPIGAGNTHADFPRGFVELVALTPARRVDLPAGADLVPLKVPDDRLAATRAAMERTVAGLAARLAAFEGAHILVFATTDAELTAARLTEAGVGHGGARAAQRPIKTAEGTRLEAITYLEIDDDPATASGLVPEGRVGAAQDAPPEILDLQTGFDHPNGATGLVECVVCVGDDRAAATAERYERYLGIPPEHRDSSWSFDLGSGRLTLTTRSGLAALLPGERPRTTPALSAYAVEVADLSRAEAWLHSRGVETRRTIDGEPFVPAATAHGAAVVLRQSASA